MNMKSKSILPVCLLFSFTACQNVEHSFEEKRTSTSELDRSDPQGGGGRQIAS